MEKTPVILLPGSLCDERLWQPQLEFLTDLAEMTVGKLSDFDRIEDLAENILSEAPEKFALAGLSLGGIVALEIMRIAPERVMKLALFDTNPFPPRMDQKATWNKFLKMVDDNKFLEITEKHLMPVLIHRDHQKNKVLVDTIIQMAKTIGEKAYVNQLLAIMNREDQRGILPTIKCPTTVIVGRQDAVCPIEMSEYMVKKIPQAKLRVVENAGHLPTLEQSEIVNTYMREWLLT